MIDGRSPAALLGWLTHSKGIGPRVMPVNRAGYFDSAVGGGLCRFLAQPTRTVDPVGSAFALSGSFAADERYLLRGAD